MPNIEIYDLMCPGIVRDTLEKSNLKFKGDIVITTIDSTCHNLSGRMKSFLRICDTDPKRAEKLVKVLEKLGYDIEVLILKRFYPTGF